MTDDPTTRTVDETEPNATMGEFTHTNPYTGETFGEEMAFDRGPTVAADGGERDAAPGAPGEPDDVTDGVTDDATDVPDGVTDVGPAAEDDEPQTMKDVDHEHPHDDADEANRVFKRGGRETGDDTV